MTKDWATTIAELITYPVTIITDAVDWAIGTEPHERLPSIVKTEVFADSHLRNMDKISGDRKLYLGNVMRVSRRLAATIPYYHYGIYIGKGCVIHFTGQSADEVPSENLIRETSLEAFVKDASTIEILQFPKEIFYKGNTFETFSPAEAVSRAANRLGDCDYNLFTNNCEHFVMWCRTGIKFSSQVLGAREFVESKLESHPSVGFYRPFPNGPIVDGPGPENPVAPALALIAVKAALADSTRKLGEFGIEVSRAIFSSNCITT